MSKGGGGGMMGKGMGSSPGGMGGAGGASKGGGGGMMGKGMGSSPGGMSKGMAPAGRGMNSSPGMKGGSAMAGRGGSQGMAPAGRGQMNSSPGMQGGRGMAGRGQMNAGAGRGSQGMGQMNSGPGMEGGGGMAGRGSTGGRGPGMQGSSMAGRGGQGMSPSGRGGAGGRGPGMSSPRGQADSSMGGRGSRMGSNNVYADSSYEDGPDNDYVRGSSQGSRRMSGDEFRRSASRSSFMGNEYEFDEYGQLSTDNFGYKSGSRPPVSGSDTRGRGVLDEGRRNVLKNLSNQVPRYARSSSIGNQYDFRQRRPDRLSRSLGYSEDYDEYDDYDRPSQGSYSGKPMVDYIERNPDRYSREIGSFSKPKYSPWGPVGESLIDYQYKNTRSPRGSNYDFYNDSSYNRRDGGMLNDRNDPRAPRYNDNFDDSDFGPPRRGGYDSFGDRGLGRRPSGPQGRGGYDSFDDRGPGRGPGGRPSGPQGRGGYDSFDDRGPGRRPSGPQGRGGYDSFDDRGPGRGPGRRPRDDYDSGPRGGPRDRYDSFDDRGGPRGRSNYDDDDDSYLPRNLSRDELQQRRSDLMDYIEDQEFGGGPMMKAGANTNRMSRDPRGNDRMMQEFDGMDDGYGDEFDSYY
jgi:hypothetical protein